ncbi:MAG: TetR/AcrR family transcriptional regulator [Actinobacteria bacterium]|nr:TetR/AcrR family transcriptional regulator [Actinomycetota bacterium]
MTAAPGGWSTDGDGHARITGHQQFTFEDPLSSLPETARNLLIAAKEIVAEDGFEALTLKAVSERAGENKAMVAYYFDNKAGLVAAVLESVIHDEYLDSLDRMKNVTPDERIPRLVGEMQRMAAWADDFQVFYELLPHALRDEALRRRLAMLYRWYWKMKLEWFGIGDGAAALADPDLLGLAQLLSAIIDGLAVQTAVDPDVDLANPYRVLARMLEHEAAPAAGPSNPCGADGQGAEAAGRVPQPRQ